MTRILKADIDGRVNTWIIAATVTDSAVKHLEPLLPQASPDLLDGWIEELRRSESKIRGVRQRLEALRDSTDKRCPVCGRAVTGRADRIYCRDGCRLLAHRQDVLRTARGPADGAGNETAGQEA